MDDTDAHFNDMLNAIRRDGLLKEERILDSPQAAYLQTADGRRVLNLCSNNYLGLSNDPRLVKAAREGMTQWGFGLSSVRFICGTQAIHKKLEARLSRFLGTDDTILHSSCFDANGGLFEALLGPEDAVISDELNHASIIDGIRLCKARRLRYRNNDMQDLERALREAAGARVRMIATDGVFSMDGVVADLAAVCDLAARHNALVMVDDSHAVGVLGARGRGTHERCGVMGRVDIITGTFGKALGGASGGYASGRRAIVELLRQRSRPYLFSNSLPPAMVCAALKALDIIEESSEPRDRLAENTRFFRSGIRKLGFAVSGDEHPIVPIILGDARLAAAMADRLLELGVHAVAFSHPVVPRGKARVRVQISAAHSRADLERALDALRQAWDELAPRPMEPAPLR